VIPLFADAVRNDGIVLFPRAAPFAARGKKPCPDGNRLSDDLLLQGAVEEFHDVHDILAGFVDFGAGA
jgi:hypothetical protein